MTTMRKGSRLRHTAISVSALALSLALAAPAGAQTTSTLRGEHATPGATVTATDLTTGQKVTATVDPNGTFVMAGVRPSSYRIEGAGETVDVTVPVGQTVTIDAAPPEATAAAGDIVVKGRRNRVEVRTATVGTSVSQQQIENLPQNDRNFLNFAGLAPGVSVSAGDAGQNNKKIQAGAVSADNINVYIDGTSHKNQVGYNGVAGQNFSQGNPFPQSAVQEFRVETQNFKAEYEQAGSAIITAITKTGGQEFHGGAFVQLMPKKLFGRPFFDRPGEAGNMGFPCPDDASQTCYREKPDFKRWQFGANLGGPIIAGKLHFFAAYEGTRQSNPSASFNIVEPYASRFDTTDTATDFKQNLYFGKLTFFASDADTLHASYFLRKESDVRDFGDRALREHGRDLGTTTKNYQLEWNHRGDNWLNEMTLGYFDSFTGTPRITDAPEVRLTNGINGNELVILGGNSFQQANQQKDLNFKNNVTYTGFDGHVIKAGVRLSKTKLTRIEDANALGSYAFDGASYTTFDGSTPYSARISLLPPTPMTAKNTMLGLFVQDDWTIDDHWTVNYGLRWDFENNNFNQDFVTPDKIATALRNYVGWQAAGINPEDYITDGTKRKPFYGAFQPRIGVSYDVFGDRDLILFAGAGRYYDRNNFYNASIETLFSYRRSDINVTFCGAAGLPACSIAGGNNANGEFQWDPAYRDPAALRAAIGAFGLSGDIYVLNNKTPVPYTDQFNVGIRKKFGDWQTSLTVAHNRSHNGFIYVRANRMPDGSYTPDGYAYIRDNFPPEGRPPGYTGRVDVGSSKGKSRYTALYLQAEKPWSNESNWGATMAVTISNAKSNQARAYGEFEMFNAGEQDAYGWQPVHGLERWRFVGTGMVGLPWDLRASATVTMSSGPRFGSVRFDNLPCGGCIPFNEAGVYSPEKTIAYKTVDARIAKTFKFGNGHEVTADFQVYNLFDWVNRTYSTWGAGSGNPPPLKENSTVGYARSFQAGLKYSF